MARDHEKYLYVQVSFTKGSALHAAFTADVQASGAAPSDVILVKLAERYGLTSSTAPAPVAPVEQPRSAEPDMSQADKNATLAASVWGD